MYRLRAAAMCEAVSNLFLERLGRLRSGQSEALEEFVATYEPFIRRTIRFRIARAGLKQASDSVDVCQSVLGGFLIRLAVGDYELASEADLRKLLASIANKKFLMLQRRESAAKRDRRQTHSLEQCKEIADYRNQPADASSIGAELFFRVVNRLAPDERQLFELRSRGESWLTISAQIGEESTVLRKRLSRALRRVAVELGLEDGDD